MINKHKIIFTVIFLMLLVAVFIRFKQGGSRENGKTKIIKPAIADVSLTVSATGIVKPQNRLEIKPPISGRIENILVKEGDKIKKGEILLWMSSTERAALVDAARSQGQEALDYWEEVYKKTPIVSPIDGEVIVRSVEPGQTASSSDVVLVLSDRLVISAQFDETDIGRVKVGQKAFITLDAYPDIKIEGLVDHIAYESEIVNNVTIYNVDILPSEVPDILRSGMSVTVEVVEKTITNVLTIPSNAIGYEGKRQFVLVKNKWGKITPRDINVGLNNDKIAQVISGLSLEDSVVVDDSFLPTRKNTLSSPFMPSRQRNR